MDELICPRCKGKEFEEFDCGPDSYDDDIIWQSWKCRKCGLWYSDWTDRWLIDCDSWIEEEDAKEYKVKKNEKHKN